MPEKEIGKVSDFFARPVVAGIEMSGSIKLGDKIHIKGHTTDMEFVVDSMVTAVAERIMLQPVVINISCPHCGKNIEVALIGSAKPGT